MAPTDPASLTASDMLKARQQTYFSPDVLNDLLNAEARDPEMRKKVLEIMKKEPLFAKTDRPYLSRKQRLLKGLEMTRRLFELCDEHDLDYMEYLEALFYTDEHLGIYLHEVAFFPVIQSQGSDEQQMEWITACTNHEILGCYAQTELAHGSNVQKLETTATYVPETEEFEIHSPTVTATKWWIGGLGMLCTHCVVQARLILKGKDYGPHLFICQLRDMDTHAVLPGREIGEIGPKVMNAFAALDNGYIRFNKVRVPRKNMLNRFAQVSAEGTYNKPPHDKLSYGSMIFIRANMIGQCGWALAKAATISSRYCTVRRQFADPEAGAEAEDQERQGGENGANGGAGQLEKQVIYYPSVYLRVLPVVARAWVFVTIGKDMINLFTKMASQLARGNTDLLAETHAVSSGLKAYCTAETVQGMETARRAMGGHGFLESAGIGRLYASQLPSVTYEGDNFILCLQVCRAALKTLRLIRTSKQSPTSLSDSSAYLSVLFSPPNLPSLTSSSAFSDPKVQAGLLDLRAAFHVQRLENLLASGKKWGDLSWECQSASKAIVESFLVRRMNVALDGGLLDTNISDKERQAVRDLIFFHNLYLVSQASGDLFEFGLMPVSASTRSGSSASSSLSSDPIEVLRSTLDDYGRKLVPIVVGLTDAFGFDDWDLDSSLGKYDGRVYEDLLERAQRDAKMNAGEEEERRIGYEKGIKPILERGARLSRL